jgi:hypothetical protein
MKDKGVFLVSQMTGISPYLNQHPGLVSQVNKAKLAASQELSKDYVANVKAVRPTMAFQTDVVFTTAEAMRAQVDYEKWFHAKLFGNHAMLVAATSAAGELVDGNPLENISVIGGNEKWYDAEPRGPNIPTLRIIMKDGRIYKNTLTDWRPEYLKKPDLSTLRTSETY